MLCAIYVVISFVVSFLVDKWHVGVIWSCADVITSVQLWLSWWSVVLNCAIEVRCQCGVGFLKLSRLRFWLSCWLFLVVLFRSIWRLLPTTAAKEIDVLDLGRSPLSDFAVVWLVVCIVSGVLLMFW